MVSHAPRQRAVGTGFVGDRRREQLLATFQRLLICYSTGVPRWFPSSHAGEEGEQARKHDPLSQVERGSFGIGLFADRHTRL